MPFVYQPPADVQGFAVEICRCRGANPAVFFDFIAGETS